MQACVCAHVLVCDTLIKAVSSHRILESAAKVCHFQGVIMQNVCVCVCVVYFYAWTAESLSYAWDFHLTAHSIQTDIIHMKQNTANLCQFIADASQCYDSLHHMERKGLENQMKKYKNTQKKYTSLSNAYTLLHLSLSVPFHPCCPVLHFFFYH